jgi:hypothetical protein
MVSIGVWFLLLGILFVSNGEVLWDGLGSNDQERIGNVLQEFFESTSGNNFFSFDCFPRFLFNVIQI